MKPNAVTASHVRLAMKLEAGYVAEIEHLKAWIKHAGQVADICTRDVLGEVCDTCRCKHAPKAKRDVSP